MKFVRTGFCDGVYRGSGMKAVLRREHAGLDFELLQGIRKGYRQREAVVWILVYRAAQIVGNRVALAAGHGHHDRGIIPHRVDGAVARRGGHTGKEYQLDRIAAIQRHLRNAQVIHNLPDARGTRFHLCEVRLDRQFFTHRADFQWNVDRQVAVHLQHDAFFNVSRKTRLDGFQHVWAERKVRKHVPAVLVRECRSSCSSRGLRYFYLDAGYHGAARVLNSPGNLSGRLSP